MSKLYDVLRRPIITEKSNYQAGLRQYVFEVSPDANRILIKQAVETAFKVNVVRVNVINVSAKQGRKSRSRRMVITGTPYKKAIVTLAPNETIPLFEGV